MGRLKKWWHENSATEKEAQIIALLTVFAISSFINNAYVSISMGMAAVYILYDSARRQNLSGFYIEKENWLGIVVFLNSVLLASLLSGDLESVHIAIKYIYWAAPFLVIAYLTKKAEIKYAAIIGIGISMIVTAAHTGYLYYLFLQGKYIGFIPGRIGAFDVHPNMCASLLECMLPFAVCFLADRQVKRQRFFLFFTSVVIALGLWTLWKTGSRGGMTGCAIGGIFVFITYCYRGKKPKLFLTGTLVSAILFASIMHMGMMSGIKRTYDYERLLLWKSSYIMWEDHKVFGLGLNNWHTSYVKKYIAKEAKEREQVSPHNSLAWFFSTTGIIGGAGYLFLLFYYGVLLFRKTKQEPFQWLFYAGLWAFIAVHMHGMVDMGMTNKATARLMYLMLGLALCSSGTGTKEKSA